MVTFLRAGFRNERSGDWFIHFEWHWWRRKAASQSSSSVVRN